MKNQTQREMLAITKEKNKALMAYLQKCNRYFEVPQLLTVKLINSCVDLELLQELYTFYNSYRIKVTNELVANFLSHSKVNLDEFKDIEKYEFALTGLLQEFYLKIFEKSIASN